MKHIEVSEKKKKRLKKIAKYKNSCLTLKEGNIAQKIYNFLYKKHKKELGTEENTRSTKLFQNKNLKFTQVPRRITKKI